MSCPLSATSSIRAAMAPRRRTSSSLGGRGGEAASAAVMSTAGATMGSSVGSLKGSSADSAATILAPMPDAIRTIAVVGAGLMGHGIAQVFALAGRDVVLTDANPEALPKARDGIARILDLFVEHDLATRTEADAALRRVKLEPAFAAALGDADYVVEAVFEDVELKQRVFADLDRACRPGVILT